MKKLIIIMAAAAIALPAFAQKEAKQTFTPKKGDVSFGLTINPMALREDLRYQPETGEFAGTFIGGLGADPKQMFFLARDPLASLQFKFRMSDKWSFRANLGFDGSIINYKEYCYDDVATRTNPLSEEVVTDVIHNKMNGIFAIAALEFNKTFGQFQFNAGFGLQYVIGGGSMTFDYGNDLTKEGGWQATTIPLLKPGTDPEKTLNTFPTGTLGIAWARPVERYNIGYNHGIGLTFDMGLEWFFTGRLSLSAALTMVPVMYVFQPQTWAIYEGYSATTESILTYNDLVSPGSNGLLYGTENLGFRIGFNCYFGK